MWRFNSETVSTICRVKVVSAIFVRDKLFTDIRAVLSVSVSTNAQCKHKPNKEIKPFFLIS